MKLLITVWRFSLFAFCLLLVSCSHVEPTPPVPPQPQARMLLAPAAENLGQQVARHLNDRYNNKAVNCGSASQPAFLCSGIMIRGTATNPAYHVWNNSKPSKDKGGVSFGYLRQDTSFRQLPLYYTNGFIFQSYSHVPAKLHPEVLCSFPIDGYTDGRTVAGCGQHSKYLSSRPCDVVGITTGTQWWAAYNSRPSYRYQQQCGFDVRDARNALSGPAFYASIQGRASMGESESRLNNEIIVKAWADNLGKTLPLEAFFYLSGSVSGRKDAKRNQLDLRDTDGVVIPIISIRLSRAVGDPATFYYLAGDQAVAMPPALP